MGAPQLIEVALQRALDFGERTTWLLKRLSEVQMRLQRWEDAEHTLHRLVEREPRYVPGMSDLAHLAYRDGRLDEAARWLERAQRRAPDDPDLAAQAARVRAARESRAGSQP